MVRLCRVRLPACSMCPPVIRSRSLRGHHGENILKYHECCERLRALPLKAMECEKGRCPCESGSRSGFCRPSSVAQPHPRTLEENCLVSLFVLEDDLYPLQRHYRTLLLEV